MKFNTIPLKVLLVVLLFIGTYHIHAQVIINEILASNNSINEDSLFGNNADWIEIYNSGNSAIDLNGYFITDNLDEPAKWKFKTSFIINAGEYALVWADGNDTLGHTNFKISADGEEIGLFSPDTVLLDSVSFKLQALDISFGRSGSDSTKWVFFQYPSPKLPNPPNNYNGFTTIYPEFSVRGGFYDTGIQLSITSFQGGVVRYTTDGSEPKITSPEFTNPITIDTTTIVRARIFQPKMIPGPVITNSYFINENFEERGLPVVSVVSDPYNFWDADSGIYVTRDFKPEWEIPGNIELFENDGSNRAGFNERVGIKINGLYAWQLPEKMLGIYFKKKYGAGSLDYPLFSDAKRRIYKSFALRASGSDWSYSLFRDMFGHEASKLYSNMDIMNYKQSVVFINGQHMGIHNIREKVEENYIVEHYGIKGNSFDMIENEELVECGDSVNYLAFKALYSKDLSVKANYDAVINAMDVNVFTDFIIAEYYSGNTSIDHNVMAWKPKEGGKWKWILMDLDRGYFNANQNFLRFFLDQTVYPFSSLMKNNDYKTLFIKRLSNRLYTNYNPIRLNTIIDGFAGKIRNEIPYHTDTWEGATSSWGDAIASPAAWEDEVTVLRNYANARTQYLYNDMANYGITATSNLEISNSPLNGGSVTIDSFPIPEAQWNGVYPQNLPFQLQATAKPGFEFQGWAEASELILITKTDEWKYLDDGSNQGTTWKDPNFNDNTWQTGAAELGYGDDDEATTVSYGTSANNKYITTYFRKNITISQSDFDKNGTYFLNLLYDDGAVVYINGTEVVRANMPTGTITSTTLARGAAANETAFTKYTVPEGILKAGNNIIAVEIHQNSATSSDLSFNLELSTSQVGTTLISTNRTLELTLTGNKSVQAVYQSTGQCILPEKIDQDMHLTKSCSPYVAQGTVTIAPTANLLIDAGVEIYMPTDADIIIYGSIQANGAEGDTIVFKLNPEYSGSWGALSFVNTPVVSTMSYIEVKNATTGLMPGRDVGAISAFHADLKLDHIKIVDVYKNPIHARYSRVELTNSIIHLSVTGDCINIKYGEGLIDNCEFYGNSFVDADGIDYDNVKDGIIRNCIIHDFVGDNNDAIDIGEKADNVMIENIIAYNIFDKGVSVGQRSTASIKNSTFINCNYGIGVKDSCQAFVDHCNYYGCNYAIACYEKNIGSAGGNAIVTNTIISNSTTDPLFIDDKSTAVFKNCLTDKDSLNGVSNLHDDPLFIDPVHSNFKLQALSPCIGKGNDGKNIGYGESYSFVPADPMFVRISVNAQNKNQPEFIAIYNPRNKAVDMSDWKIDKGITTTIPFGTIINPQDTLYLTDTIEHSFWTTISSPVIEWESGKLSNNGESVELIDNYGLIKDYLKYKDTLPWPEVAFLAGVPMILSGSTVDNHFGKNWTAYDPCNVSAPIVKTDTVCQGQTGILTATGTAIIWYNESGEFVSNGNTFETNESAKFYATQTIQSCESPKAGVALVINPIPPAPVVSSNPVCQGQTGTFTAQGTDIKWYSEQSGASIAQGTTYQTDKSQVFYATQSLKGCESPKKPTTLTINSIPAAAVVSSDSVCSGESGIIAALGTNIKWYDSQTGTSIASGNTYETNQTSTFYASQTVNSCESPKIPVNIATKAIPAAPAISSETVCEGKSGILSAVGANIKWYDSQSLTSIASGNTYTTNKTTVFYASQTVSFCESPKSQITLNSVPNPASPTTQDASACENSSATLTATGVGEISWYNAFNEQVSNTSSYTTDVAGTYYAVSTLNNCSSQKAQATVTIIPNPAAVYAESKSVVLNDAVPQLTVTNGTGTINWYDINDDILFTGTNFTPSITTDTDTTYTFRVNQDVQGCQSEKSIVSITITNPACNLLPPMVSSKHIDICHGTEAPTILVSGSNITVTWKDETGRIVTTGNSYKLPFTEVGSYLVSVTQSDNFCESPATIVEVNIHPVPVVKLIVPASAVYENTAPFTLETSPLNGQFSGSGVIDATFYPSEAGVGEHVIGYTFTSEFGCSNSTMGFITVLGIDKSNLIAMRDSAQTIYNSIKGTDKEGTLYSTTSLDQLLSAIDEANQILNSNSGQPVIDAGTSSLETEIANFYKSKIVTTIDYSKIDQTINTALSLISSVTSNNQIGTEPGMYPLDALNILISTTTDVQNTRETATKQIDINTANIELLQAIAEFQASVIIETVNKSALEAIINYAESIYNDVHGSPEEGKTYSTETIGQLYTDINSAILVLENPNANQLQVDATTKELQDNITKFFNSKIVVELDYTKLDSLISHAQELIQTIEANDLIGTDEGDYPQSEYVIFQNAFNNAVAQRDLAETQATVNIIKYQLENALINFENSRIVKAKAIAITNKNALQTLAVGTYTTLNYSLTPADAVDKVILVSSNTSVLFINQSGDIIVLAPGTVTVFAYVESNPQISDMVEITCTQEGVNVVELSASPDIKILKNSIQISNSRGITSVQLYTTNGQHLLSFRPGIDELIEIETQSLIHGAYILVVQDKNGVIKSRKFVK